MKRRGERLQVFVPFVRRRRTTIDEIEVHGFSTIHLNEFLGREERKEGKEEKRQREKERESPTRKEEVAKRCRKKRPCRISPSYLHTPEGTST